MKGNLLSTDTVFVEDQRNSIHWYNQGKKKSHNPNSAVDHGWCTLLYNYDKQTSSYLNTMNPNLPNNLFFVNVIIFVDSYFLISFQEGEKFIAYKDATLRKCLPKPAI